MYRYNIVLLICDLRTGQFGQGAFVQNLLPYFKNCPDIAITLIKTDCPNLTSTIRYTEDGFEIIALPCLQKGSMMTGENNSFQKFYANRFIGMIYPLLKEKPNLLFWGNSIDYLNVFYELKKVFPAARLMYVHHSFSWKYLINVEDPIFTREWNAGNGSFHPKAFEMTRYQQEMALLSDIVITVTAHARNFFIETLKVDAKKINLIYNGCSIPVLNKNKQQLRKKYGFGKHHKIILFSGRITRDKGFGHLLKAFKLLADENKHVRLVIMGAGKPLEEIALANPHWSKIVFTGNLEKRQVREFYQMAEVGVIPSLHEQCSFTAIEMRFSKLPVVATSYDGLGEVFRDRYDALIIPPRSNILGERIIDEKEMAHKILELLKNRGLSKYLAENSFRKAAQLFSAENMGKEYGNILSGLFT